jgi:hypothetical protein
MNRRPQYPEAFDDRLVLLQLFDADPSDAQTLALQLYTAGRHVLV